MHKKRRRPVHHPLLVSYLADVMEKLTSQARDRGKMSTLDETKNRGSIRHRPPPSPTAPTSYRQLFCSFNTSLTLWYDIS